MAGEGPPHEETSPVGLRRKLPASNVRQALCVESAWLRALLRRLKEQLRLGGTEAREMKSSFVCGFWL